MTKIPKPPINVLYDNQTNRWSRNGQAVEYILLLLAFNGGWGMGGFGGGMMWPMMMGGMGG